jgi:hypothetical protein
VAGTGEKKTMWSFDLLVVVLSPALIIHDEIIRELLFLMSVLIAVGWLGSDWVNRVKGGCVV